MVTGNSSPRPATRGEARVKSSPGVRVSFAPDVILRNSSPVSESVVDNKSYRRKQRNIHRPRPKSTSGLPKPRIAGLLRPGVVSLLQPPDLSCSSKTSTEFPKTKTRKENKHRSSREQTPSSKNRLKSGKLTQNYERAISTTISQTEFFRIKKQSNQNQSRPKGALYSSQVGLSSSGLSTSGKEVLRSLEQRNNGGVLIYVDDVSYSSSECSDYDDAFYQSREEEEEDFVRHLFKDRQNEGKGGEKVMDKLGDRNSDSDLSDRPVCRKLSAQGKQDDPGSRLTSSRLNTGERHVRRKSSG